MLDTSSLAPLALGSRSNMARSKKTPAKKGSLKQSLITDFFPTSKTIYCCAHFPLCDCPRARCFKSWIPCEAIKRAAAETSTNFKQKLITEYLLYCQEHAGEQSTFTRVTYCCSSYPCCDCPRPRTKRECVRWPIPSYTNETVPKRKKYRYQHSAAMHATPFSKHTTCKGFDTCNKFPYCKCDPEQLSGEIRTFAYCNELIDCYRWPACPCPRKSLCSYRING